MNRLILWYHDILSLFDKRFIITHRGYYVLFRRTPFDKKEKLYGMKLILLFKKPKLRTFVSTTDYSVNVGAENIDTLVQEMGWKINSLIDLYEEDKAKKTAKSVINQAAERVKKEYELVV